MTINRVPTLLYLRRVLLGLVAIPLAPFAVVGSALYGLGYALERSLRR